jgi:hypothetical protein
MPRSAAVASFALLLSPALLGVDAPEEQPARVQVEVLAGAPAMPAVLPALAPGDVHVVIDLTPSLAEQKRQGTDLLEASRAAADRLLRQLPQDRPVTLHALGVRSGSQCAGSAPAVFPSGAAAAGFVRTAQPRGEGSLATALEGVAGTLVAEQRGGARVVAIGALDSSCGGDLCAAARAIDAAGAELDLVLLGGGSAPACLAGERSAPLSVAAAVPKPREPRFRVEPWPAVEGGTGADGVAGRQDVLVRGTGQVAVLLSEPEDLYVGPLQPRPGATLHLRVLSFPALGVREVWLGGQRFAERGRIGPSP